jgi:hypothetical protein
LTIGVVKSLREVSLLNAWAGGGAGGGGGETRTGQGKPGEARRGQRRPGEARGGQGSQGKGGSRPEDKKVIFHARETNKNQQSFARDPKVEI